MSKSQAQYLIELINQHGGDVCLTERHTLKLINHKQLPNEVIEAVKHNTKDLYQYLQQQVKPQPDTDHAISRYLERALKGYDWLVEQYARKHNLPISDVYIMAQHWRDTIKQVIRLNDAEVGLIEQLLIDNGDLVYIRGGGIARPMQDVFLPDNGTGEAFNHWLESGSFLYH